jgi:hypothetical protein
VNSKIKHYSAAILLLDHTFDHTIKSFDFMDRLGYKLASFSVFGVKREHLRTDKRSANVKLIRLSECLGYPVEGSHSKKETMMALTGFCIVGVAAK